MLLRVIQKRYGELPDGLVAAIRACNDSDQLDRWVDAVAGAATLEQLSWLTGLCLGEPPLIESPVIAELLAEARARVKGKVPLQVIWNRYGELPDALAASVGACKDEVQLDGWLDAAAEAKSLGQFRQRTGL